MTCPWAWSARGLTTIAGTRKQADRGISRGLAGSAAAHGFPAKVPGEVPVDNKRICCMKICVLTAAAALGWAASIHAAPMALDEIRGEEKAVTTPAPFVPPPITRKYA